MPNDLCHFSLAMGMCLRELRHQFVRIATPIFLCLLFGGASAWFIQAWRHLRLFTHVCVVGGKQTAQTPARFRHYGFPGRFFIYMTDSPCKQGGRRSAQSLRPRGNFGLERTPSYESRFDKNAAAPWKGPVRWK